MTARFAGQVAVVTGGALGIGGGISRRLAAAGAHVVLADIDADAAAATRDEIVAAGRRCTIVVGDIRDRDVVAAVAETARSVADSRVVAQHGIRGRDPDLIRTWIPAGRFGQPDDYAAVVEFLASDDARFVTGQTIPVDGGTLAASGWYARADRKGWTNMPNEA